MREAFFYIYLLFQFNFLGLMYDDSQSYNLVRLLGGITIIALILNVNKIKLKGKFTWIILFLMLYVLLEILISSILYSTSIHVMFAFSLGFATCLAYFLFNNVEHERLTRRLCWFSTITITILTSLYLIFIFTGAEPLIKFSEIPLRMGVQRIYVGAYLFPYCFILALSKIIRYSNLKQRIPPLYIITLALTLFDLFFFIMTRAYLVILLFVAFVMILVFLKWKPKIYLFITIAFFILIIGINNIGILKAYIEFSQDADSDTMSIRYAAMNYYFNQTINGNFITGLGFIKPDSYALRTLLNGPHEEFYREDVGIWGFFNTFGLIGLLWFISYILRATQIVMIKFKAKTIYNNPEFFGILLFFILAQFSTINIIDYGGIGALPIISLLLNSNIKKGPNLKQLIIAKQNASTKI
ncbi:hypothetical protein [Parabacteroides sp. FAFU027]|uniref:hypothetical protein n=1 Tax=Parabacteroides sp. FAFU027 TaxID=2922715 RepID=UPI001FAF3082|nr:hypothetical protein [Parabacteroides sp. FAFU027]